MKMIAFKNASLWNVLYCFNARGVIKKFQDLNLFVSIITRACNRM